MSQADRRRHVHVETSDGVRLHAAVQGSDAPPLILLHGFPDRWSVWRRVMDHLSPRRLAAAPDGRGVNLSGKPPGLEAYGLRRLAADVLAVADGIAPGAPFHLVGHDWGGVVAWAAAGLHPGRVARLTVCNAPHPAVLAEALTDDPSQQAASAYFDLLRAPEAESRLGADGFARLRAVFDGLRAKGVLTPEDDAEAVQAWSQPGALAGALNWYRAADFAKPGGRSPVPADPLDMPVTLIWGEDDGALPPSLAERHRRFCRRLAVRLLPGVGHWPPLEAPDVVAEALRDY